MMLPEDRYRVDPVFKSLVNVLCSMLERDGSRLFTPTEVREAAILATCMYENIHIRPLVMMRSGNPMPPRENK